MIIKSTTNKNSYLIYLVFWLTILFQITALKYIWSIEQLSRVANMAALLFLTAYALMSFISGVFSRNIWNFYILPGVFIFAGMIVNISLNAIFNLNLISYYGLTLPWATYLCVPGLMRNGAINTKILWLYYYYFMLIVCIIGFLDYALIFSGATHGRILITPNGVFIGGLFSLLHMLEDGTAYARFYACFYEPGTLAMFLLPAISYAFSYKRFFGLLVFLAAFFMTFSLGGAIGMIILVIVNTYRSYRGSFIIAILIGVVSAFVLWIATAEHILTSYEEKDASRTIREENLVNTIYFLPALICDSPFGFQLEEDTESALKQELYFGSNFSPGNMLRVGGISAFFGYLFCLFVSSGIAITSLRKRNLSHEDKTAFSSLIFLFPFIFQRTAIWDSTMFALLFAPSILRVLQPGRKSLFHKCKTDRSLSQYTLAVK